LLCIFALTFGFEQRTLACSTFSITPSGDGNFVLRGVGIENAAALEITLHYDITALSNPRVVQGGLIAGAMMAVNPNVPGTVHMVIIRTTPITGSGAIATLSFSRKGSAAGKILSMSVRLADMSGTPLSAHAHIVNSPDSTATTSTSSQNQGSVTATGAQAGTAAHRRLQPSLP
jgi:hypothetical protein